MTVPVSGGFEDGGRAFLRERRKQMPFPRGQYRLHRDLHIPIRAILEPDRHGEPRCKLAVYLALNGARAYRSPAHEIRIKLTEGGVEKLGRCGKTEIREVGKKLSCEPQSLVDPIGSIQIRIVD